MKAGRPDAPGQLEQHYAPRAKVILDVVWPRFDVGLLAFGPQVPRHPGPVLNLSASGNLEEAAANLFRMMHELDEAGVQTIAVMPIPTGRPWRGDQRPAGARCRALPSLMKTIRRRENIERFVAVVGRDNAITVAEAMEPYLREWRERWTGKAEAVLRPEDHRGGVAESSRSRMRPKRRSSRRAAIPGAVGGQMPFGGGR